MLKPGVIGNSGVLAAGRHVFFFALYNFSEAISVPIPSGSHAFAILRVRKNVFFKQNRKTGDGLGGARAQTHAHARQSSVGGRDVGQTIHIQLLPRPVVFACEASHANAISNTQIHQAHWFASILK